MGCAVWTKNPFNPLKDREVFAVEDGLTVRGFLDRRGIGDFPLPTVCFWNGRPALRREWSELVIGAADVVEFRAFPHGGGGGGGGKQILSTVAMIALMVAAPEIGAALAPEIGSFAAAELGVGLTMEVATAIGAGAVIGGGMLLTSAMFSSPKAAMPSSSWGGFGTPPAPSPTYGLSPSGNQARLGQTIPEMFGRHKVVFDLGSDPYQEYVDNEQYLYQLHVVGIGEYEFERLLIDDTPISSFEEVEFQIVPPGGAMTLIDHVVVTAAEVAGQEAQGTNQLSDGAEGWLGPFVPSPAAHKATHLGVDMVFSRGLYYATDSGSLTSKTGTWRVEAREIDDEGNAVESSALAALPGGLTKARGRLLFTVNPSAGDTATLNGKVWTFVSGSPGAFQVQIGAAVADTVTALAAILNASTAPALSVATYSAAGKGLVIEHDTAGLAGESFTLAASRAVPSADTLTGGAFACLGEETYTAASNSQLRVSHKYAVAAARYEVRLRRTNVNDTNSRTGHEMRWGQLRSYLDVVPDYGDVTLLAVKARATDNLSQRSSRLFNGIATRKLPLWDPATATWSDPVATRSIAAVASYILRSSNGAGLADNRNDLAMLWSLHQTWEDRGDTFDGVFDSPLTVWDALQRVVKVGRGAPFQQGGVIRYMRDEPRALASGFYSRRNIVKSSFSIDYILPTDDTADAVTVQYFSAKTWKVAEVTAAMMGGEIRIMTAAELVATPPERPAKEQMFGVTGREQAEREACFRFACHYYRRIQPKWQTEYDGRVAAYGDVVAVSHPLPSWGQDGEVEDWDPDTGIMTLSEPPRWTEGAVHYMGLRQRNGSLASPAVEIEPDPDGDPYKVKVIGTLPLVPDTGGDRERTYYALGPGLDLWSRRVRIKSIKPRAKRVEIEAVLEDDRVHIN